MLGTKIAKNASGGYSLFTVNESGRMSCVLNTPWLHIAREHEARIQRDVQKTA